MIDDWGLTIGDLGLMIGDWGLLPDYWRFKTGNHKFENPSKGLFWKVLVIEYCDLV